MNSAIFLDASFGKKAGERRSVSIYFKGFAALGLPSGDGEEVGDVEDGPVVARHAGPGREGHGEGVLVTDVGPGTENA